MSTLHIKIPKLTRGQLQAGCASGAKVCYVCKEQKIYADFGVNRSRFDGLQTYCKQCAKAKQTEWYYGRKHKLTLEARDALLAAQGGKCKICGVETEFQFKKGHARNIGNFAVVDHCHDSLKIRGILCGSCNTGLGAFKDNPFALEAAIQYLLETAEK